MMVALFSFELLFRIIWVNNKIQLKRGKKTLLLFLKKLIKTSLIEEVKKQKIKIRILYE
jgi:hypothetical protein